jgi:hypothetical protein
MRNYTLTTIVVAVLFMSGCTRNNNRELGASEKKQETATVAAQEAGTQREIAEKITQDRLTAVERARLQMAEARKSDWTQEVKGNEACDLWGRVAQMRAGLNEMKRFNDDLSHAMSSKITVTEIGFESPQEFEEFEEKLVADYLKKLILAVEKGTKFSCDGMLSDRYEIMTEIEEVLKGKGREYLANHNLSPEKLRKLWQVAFRDLVVEWRKDKESGDKLAPLQTALDTYHFTPVELGLTEGEAKTIREAEIGG